jgi:hypothetical protein
MVTNMVLKSLLTSLVYELLRKYSVDETTYIFFVHACWHNVYGYINQILIY